jgi:hypothetical protein
VIDVVYASAAAIISLLLLDCSRDYTAVVWTHTFISRTQRTLCNSMHNLADAWSVVSRSSFENTRASRVGSVLFTSEMQIRSRYFSCSCKLVAAETTALAAVAVLGTTAAATLHRVSGVGQAASTSSNDKNDKSSNAENDGSFADLAALVGLPGIVDDVDDNERASALIWAAFAFGDVTDVELDKTGDPDGELETMNVPAVPRQIKHYQTVHEHTDLFSF